MENKENLDKSHGIVMEFGVNLDQTAVDLLHGMTRGISKKKPRHIFCREQIGIQLQLIIRKFQTLI